MSLAKELPTVGIAGKEKAKPRNKNILYGLSVVALIGLAITLYMSLEYAGLDATGNVQRVFYFHVGAFSGAFIAFIAGVIGGIAFLKTRNNKWDTFAVAGIEVGLTLSVINLITGMVWAKPTWNTWWTWDPRLTSAAIMVLIYAAYLMLRSGIENLEKRRMFASVYGILAFSSVIFTTVIIRIRPDTIHPAVIGESPANAEGGFAMAANMGATLGVSSIVFCCLIVPALMWWRIRLANKQDRVQRLQTELAQK